MDEPSPFSQYLQTNYVPTEGETVLLHRLIATRNDKAEELALKIRVEKAISLEPIGSMEADRAVHLKFAEDHARLLSPIRRVPNEVLAIVFEHCWDVTEEPTLVGYGVSNPPQYAPVVLSHVCQSWRYLALGTPSLWHRIEVSIPGIRTVCGFVVGHKGWCRRLERVRDMVGIWVQRSSRRPIRLTIRNSENQPGAFGGEIQAVAQEKYRALVEAIFETSLRWQHLEFTFYLDPVTRPLVQLFDKNPEDFPILKSLQASIRCNQSDGCVTTNACLQAMTCSGLLAAPSLRSVSIGGLWDNIQTAKSISIFPIWETVTHFTWHAKVTRVYNGSAVALQMLHSLPQLRSCVLGLAQEYDRIFAHSTPVYLPSLTKLAFSNFPPVRGFASALNLPSLQRLDLAYTGTDWTHLGITETSKRTLELVRRFGHQLRVVTFDPLSIMTNSLRHFLDLIPNVKSLKVHGANPEILAPSLMPIVNLSLHFTSHPIICPRLESLTIRVLQVTTEQISVEKAVVEAVAYRRGHQVGVARIRWVGLLFGGGNSGFDIKGELVKRGVDIGSCKVVLQYSHSPRLSF